MSIPPGEPCRHGKTGGAGRRWPRRSAAAAAVIVGLLLAGYPLLHRDPYGGTAPVPAGVEGERAAGRMMSKASSLIAGLDRPGDWGEAFSEAEANAWLSIDLPRHAPGFLAGGVTSPEIRFLDRRAAISASVQWGPVSGRLWSLLDVTVRGDNLIAVSVDAAGVGVLPLPPGVVLRTLATQADAAGAAAEIRLIEGAPVLLVQLPGTTRTTPDRRSEYHLGGVHITPGELVLAGTTRSLPRQEGSIP